ncbi:MAG: hypothetical protein B0W54_00620 [Cellvibrio sp. 79]|nr:MAG: hypothetical protein B0W54_00620 [Cellvibrio sp. 79]
MSDAKWDIYLLGETQLGVERSTLVRNLATLFKKDVPVIEKMLRKSRSLLKANVDLATAKKYQAAIDKAGGLCELVEHGEQLFPDDALSPIAPRPTLSVAPVETATAPDTDQSSIAYSSSYEPPQAQMNGPGNMPKKRSGMSIAMIVGAVLFIPIIGILAAVALPAYQDYTIRAKVNAAVPLVDGTRAQVEKVILEKKFFPSENIMAGLPEDISTPHVRSIRLSAGAKLVVTYNAMSAGKAPTIIWTPKKSGKNIVWDCKGGTLQDKHRNPECRGGAKTDTTNAPAKKPITDLRIYSDDKTVSLVVPASWKGNRQLNANAILGVANTNEANYALVMSESKESFDDSADAATYLSLIVENLQAGSQKFQELQQARTVVINKKPARQQVVSLTVQGEKIVYILTTLESDTHFYALYAWTVESHYPQNQDMLRKVSESFSIY